jgi:hypothetical protein
MGEGHVGTKFLLRLPWKAAPKRRIFCTALYRCFERMVNIAEDGRYYSAFDHQIHSSLSTTLRCRTIRELNGR